MDFWGPTTAPQHSNKIILNDCRLVPIMGTLECSICRFNAINISLHKTSGNKGIGLIWKMHIKGMCLRMMRHHYPGRKYILCSWICSSHKTVWDVCERLSTRRQSWDLSLFTSLGHHERKRMMLVWSGDKFKMTESRSHFNLVCSKSCVNIQLSSAWSLLTLL